MQVIGRYIVSVKEWDNFLSHHETLRSVLLRFILCFLAISLYTQRSYTGTCIFQPELRIITRCIVEIICIVLIDLYDSCHYKAINIQVIFKRDNSDESCGCVFSFILFYLKRYCFLTKIIYEYYLQSLHKGFSSLF